MKIKGKKLALAFDANNENGLYWTDGKIVYYRVFKIKGADIDSFEQFSGGWAKDKKYCYSGSNRLENADPLTFEVLNFTYAKDKSNVWTIGGSIPDVDVATFQICDNGRRSLGVTIKKQKNDQILKYQVFVPYGFAKDCNKVYYYDFQGKNKIINKADTTSFQSLDDSFFGYDKNFVFCGKTIIPKAKPTTWKKLEKDYYYSKDGAYIYYFSRLIKGADPESFTVVKVPVLTGLPRQYAKDKNTGYINDRPFSLDEFEKEIEQEFKKYNEKKEKFGNICL